MRKGIATVSLSGVLQDKLVAAAGAGFDAIELFDNDLIGSPLAPRRRFANSAAAHRSRCSSPSVTSRAWRPTPSRRSCTGSAPSSA